MATSLCDPNTLSRVHPEVYSEFETRNFVIHKSSNLSSGMSIDQHMKEQYHEKDHEMQWVLQKVLVHLHVGWSQDLNYLGRLV